MPTKTAASPTPLAIAEAFETASVTHRGTTYTFRELSAEEYDQCVELSTTGEGDDKSLDTVQLLRWMIIKGSLEPKLDPAALGKLPFSAVTKISRTVNDLHFARDEDMATKACVNEECEWSVPGDSELPANATFCSKCGTEQPAELDKDGNEVRPNS